MTVESAPGASSSPSYGSLRQVGLPQVYLHIGEPKTGTTFLQQVMWRNRSELAATGVMLPGPRPLAHWRAAQDLREVPQVPDDPIGPFRGAWDRLANRALRAPRVAVISHELLAAASAEQAARAVHSLEPAEVHVVLTVRDMGSLLPAEWQETVKHRNTRAYLDWLRDVVDHEARTPDRRRWWFWRVHDTLEILRIWSAHVPRERVHVVTMPPHGTRPDLLWQRFAQVIGAGPTSVDTERARPNASLGLAAVELLRRVNAALPADMPDWFYMRGVKELLAHGVLAGGPGSGRLALPVERDAWARDHAADLVAGLAGSGYHIVGDLDELMPRPPRGHRPAPADAGLADMVDAGVAAIVGLLVELAAAPGTPEPAPAPVPAPPPTGTAKRLLVAASERSPALGRLRKAYRHAAHGTRRTRAATTERSTPS